MAGKVGNMRPEDINSLESESGVIASLIHNPEFSFYSEYLLPNHFVNKENRCIYTAICDLARKGITTIDPYNIIEDLNSTEATRKYAETLSVEKLQELMEMSDVLARSSVEEYKLLVNNIMDAAFRRDTYMKLEQCQALCCDRSQTDIEQKIYNTIDDVMTEFSTANEIPPYNEVVDECWSEIVERQQEGYSGIPTKFPTLNEYVTLESGELLLFGAEPKEGKSMMLLNCAVDLLKKDKAVLYLDSELSTRLFTARLIAHLSGVKYRDLTSGAYNAEDAQKIRDAIDWMKTRKFTHIYIPLFDKQSMFTAIKKVHHTQGLDVLIVDYFKGQDTGDAFDVYRELGGVVNMIKNQVCGDMGIAGLGAIQTTATGKAADSVRIIRNASTLAIIQSKTPEEIEEDGDECGNKKLRVVYNRNGMQMTRDEYIDLRFDGNHVLYEEAKQHIPSTPY